MTQHEHYLAALERELAWFPDRKADVQAEIDRVQELVDAELEAKKLAAAAAAAPPPVVEQPVAEPVPVVKPAKKAPAKKAAAK